MSGWNARSVALNGKLFRNAAINVANRTDLLSMGFALLVIQVQRRFKVKEYAVYKGDDLICIGTANECANRLGVLPETIRYYLTPTYQRKIAKRKTPGDCIEVIRIDDADED
jgi:hypothetical protein